MRTKRIIFDSRVFVWVGGCPAVEQAVCRSLRRQKRAIGFRLEKMNSEQTTHGACVEYCGVAGDGIARNSLAAHGLRQASERRARSKAEDTSGLAFAEAWSVPWRAIALVAG